MTSILACPNPIDEDAQCITLAHGEGGSAMRKLICERIIPRLGASIALDDAFVLPGLHGRPVISTDAFVVSPLFFPGGDIGSLSVFGTVNDLSVRGALPRWLTLSMIIEEGWPLSQLDRVLESIRTAAHECEVSIVAGDTKVVPRGAVDKLFISSTGLGTLIEPAPLGPQSIIPGDAILLSGPIGKHGLSILAARENLPFDPLPVSDCASLFAAVRSIRESNIIPRAMRDATRGGVTAVLHEWAKDCQHTLIIEESRLPVTPEVRGLCELLGLEPLHIANEGTMVVAVAQADADRTLNALRDYGGCRQAAIVGHVRKKGIAPVLVKRLREQPLYEPQGAPFPRIC